MTAETAQGAAFYCVADSRYFLGAVAMINSLRTCGHAQPIRVLDAGLEPWQRELLEAEAELVAAPDRTPPWLLKSVAPLVHPAETMVLIDTDIIVTRRLDEILERARAGAVVAFANNVDRHCEQWGELLDLGPVPRRRYLSSAFIALPHDPGLELLALVEARRGVVDFERTWWRRREQGYPFLYADQDLLNAVIAARVATEGVVALDHRLAPIPPFGGVRVVDERALRCEGEGGEPYLLHHYVAKPWLEPTHEGVYSRLLRRLLGGEDVAIRVPARVLPRRLRRGPLAYAERKRIDLGERLRYRREARR